MPVLCPFLTLIRGGAVKADGAAAHGGLAGCIRGIARRRPRCVRFFSERRDSDRRKWRR